MPGPHSILHKLQRGGIVLPLHWCGGSSIAGGLCRVAGGNLVMKSRQDRTRSDLCFPEKLCCLLRCDRVDVEAGAPFEAGDLRELGDDFQMPMVEVARFLVQR